MRLFVLSENDPVKAAPSSTYCCCGGALDGFSISVILLICMHMVSGMPDSNMMRSRHLCDAVSQPMPPIRFPVEINQLFAKFLSFKTFGAGR